MENHHFSRLDVGKASINGPFSSIFHSHGRHFPRRRKFFRLAKAPKSKVSCLEGIQDWWSRISSQVQFDPFGWMIVSSKNWMFLKCFWIWSSESWFQWFNGCIILYHCIIWIWGWFMCSPSYGHVRERRNDGQPRGIFIWKDLTWFSFNSFFFVNYNLSLTWANLKCWVIWIIPVINRN